MPLDHLWATWRSTYVGRVVDTRTAPTPEDAAGRSLFERILEASDDAGDLATGILHRGPTCFALLNRYPYTSGHLMVLTNRAVADLEDLTPAEHDELWATVRDGWAMPTSSASRPRPACSPCPSRRWGRSSGPPGPPEGQYQGWLRIGGRGR
jgi:hypothetical protein